MLEYMNTPSNFILPQAQANEPSQDEGTLAALKRIQDFKRNKLAKIYEIMQSPEAMPSSQPSPSPSQSLEAPLSLPVVATPEAIKGNVATAENKASVSREGQKGDTQKETTSVEAKDATTRATPVDTMSIRDVANAIQDNDLYRSAQSDLAALQSLKAKPSMARAIGDTAPLLDYLNLLKGRNTNFTKDLAPTEEDALLKRQEDALKLSAKGKQDNLDKVPSYYLNRTTNAVTGKNENSQILEELKKYREALEGSKGSKPPPATGAGKSPDDEIIKIRREFRNNYKTEIAGLNSANDVLKELSGLPESSILPIDLTSRVLKIMGAAPVSDVDFRNAKNLGSLSDSLANKFIALKDGTASDFTIQEAKAYFQFVQNMSRQRLEAAALDEGKLSRHGENKYLDIVGPLFGSGSSKRASEIKQGTPEQQKRREIDSFKNDVLNGLKSSAPAPVHSPQASAPNTATEKDDFKKQVLEGLKRK